MAVTPVGNPYVESSDLVANYPGASEALAERIDVVGVNPFADSAARATAIPSPVEGQMASLNDDDQLYRYSGSAWVAVGLPPGLNPVAPTSIANSGGSASTTGNTTTFTGVSSISLNGCFTSTYDNYLIMFNSTSSAAGVLTARLRVGGTDASADDYNQQRTNSAATSVSGARATGQTSWLGSNFSTGLGVMTMNLFRPALAATTLILASSSRETNTNIDTDNWGLGHNLATAYDGVSFIMATGTITGTITVYGYAK